MKTFTIIAAVAAMIAGSASAADFDTDINGDLIATAVVIDGNNFALGRDAEALQGVNQLCDTRVGDDAVLTAVVIDGNNFALGKNARAVQGSNVIGNCN